MVIRKAYSNETDIINKCINLGNYCNGEDSQYSPVFSLEDYTESNHMPVIYYALIAEQLIGYIGVSMIDNSLVEICGHILPKYRNQKIASMLLEEMFNDYEDFTIYVAVNSSNEATISFLKSYDASYMNCQCGMELSKTSYHNKPSRITLTSQSVDSITTHRAYLDNIEIGTVQIYVHEQIFTIHNVEVYKEYRKEGLGTEMLHSILQLHFKNHDKALLHVTKENLPAFKLYSKLGFIIYQKLHYYEI